MKYWDFLREIETALLSEHGSLKSLFSKETKKGKQLLNFIQEELGITAFAIVILDSIDGKLTTVQSNELQSKLEIDFPSLPYSVHDSFLTFIDLLFLGKRQIQKLKTRSTSKSFEAPEFITTLFQDRAVEKKDIFSLRKEQYTLLCPHGEIIFYMYAWRYFIRSIQTGQENLIFNKDIFDNYHLLDFEIEEFWKKERNGFSEEERDFVDLINNYREWFLDLDKEICKSINEGIGKFLDAEKGDFNASVDGGMAGTFSSNDWKDLGLINDRGELTHNYSELFEYIGLLAESDEEVKNILNDRKISRSESLEEASEVHFLLVKIIYSLFNDGKSSIEKMLQTIHINARFPIVPYYVFHTLVPKNQKKASYEHLAFPIWKSQNQEIRVGEKLEKIVKYNIYALLTVTGLSSDQELPERLQKIKVFAKLLSQPVIEKLYVNNIFKNFTGRLKYEYDAHEIRHLIDLIDKTTDAEILKEISQYFGIIFSNMPALEDDNSLPENFGNADNFQEFIFDAIKYGIKLRCIEERLGDIKTEDFPKWQEKWLPLFRIEIYDGFKNLIPDIALEVKDRLLFFSALIVAIKNTLKHADGTSVIRIVLRRKTITIINTGIRKSDFSGKSIALHPGNTEDSIRYNVSNYTGVDFLNDRIWMKKDEKNDKFTTEFPVPKIKTD